MGISVSGVEMVEDQFSFKGVVEAPRFARFPTFLRDMCFQEGLDLRIEVEKHWVRETVRYEVSGPRMTAIRCMALIEAGLDEWNER